MTLPMPTMTIYPYLLEASCWVFDDERTGLKEEAFVLGMTEMIFDVVRAKKIPEAANGFALTFAAESFDHDVELEWLSPTKAANVLGRPVNELPADGNWYGGSVFGDYMVGWLCPALFLYFKAAPPKIFVKAEPLPVGFDPIWHVEADDPRARRFVSAPDKLQS